jgi:hypothetical protein
LVVDNAGRALWAAGVIQPDLGSALGRCCEFFVDDPEALPPPTAAPARSEAVNEQTAFLALSGIRGGGYWTLFHMARAGVSFTDFLAIGDKEEASSALRKFGARMEDKRVGDWRAVRERTLERASRVQHDLDATGTRIIMAGDADFPMFREGHHAREHHRVNYRTQEPTGK